MKHNGGIETGLAGLMQIDHRPRLRCGSKAVAMVTLKQFVGDRGFGDCPMLIKYCFRAANEESVLGEFEAAESSFHNVNVGDSIVVLYDSSKPFLSAPEDSLSIIRAIARAETDLEPCDNNPMDRSGGSAAS
jgi:hypothetical protein